MRLILMAVMLESQITLKLLANYMSFSSSKRIAKVIDKLNWIEAGKGKYSIRNYCKKKITQDSIEQKHLVNDSIWEIEKVAIKKRLR